MGNARRITVFNCKGILYINPIKVLSIMNERAHIEKSMPPLDDIREALLKEM